MTSTVQEKTVQTYRVYLKASPEQVWEALTESEWTQRYGYGGAIDIEPHPGGAYRGYASEAMVGPDTRIVIVDGEIIEATKPRRLELTWRMTGDPDMATEVHSRLAYDITQDERGLTILSVTHDLTGAPRTAALVGGELPGAGGGWAFVLSDLKSLLETGAPLAG